MPKVLTNSRDNFLSVYSLVDIQSSYVSQPLTPTSSPTFNNLTLTGDAQIDGNLTVTGNTTIVGTDILMIKDNIIEINTPEVGSGVTLGLAGIQIERGALTDYQIVFRESDDSVAIGEIGNLQVLATREDNPLSDGVMTYNSVNKRLDSVNDITIPITFSSAEASTSSITGSVRVQGGVGITGSTHIDGSSYIKAGSSIGNTVSLVGTEGTLNIDGDITLYNSTKNTIAFRQAGVAPPSFTTRSNGTKLLLYPSLTGSLSDFAIGVETLGIWNSVPSSTQKFYWYTGTTERMRLDGDGTLNTVSVILTGTVSSTSSSTGTFVTSGGIGISNTTEAINSTNGGSFTTAGGLAVAKMIFIGGTSDFSKNIKVATTNYSGTDITSHGILSGGNTFTDTLTSASGTASQNNLVNLKITTLAAQNSSVTTTNASTLYIEGSPVAGTNQTLTNRYSLFVDSGITRLDGQVLLTANTTSTSFSTGTLVVTGGVGISENLNVSGASSFGQTLINTSFGTFSTLGTGSISYLVSGTIDIKSSVNDITIDAQSNDLVLNGTASVTISSANTVNGIKIGTTTSGVPVTIGHSVSEVTVGDNLTVVGDLTVSGTTTTVNSTVVTIEDNALIVNSLPNTLSDGGLLVRRYQTPNNIGTGGQVILDTPDVTSTFQSGSSTPATLVLNSSASGVNNAYQGWWIKITSGVGNNQVRRINTYNGTTKTATIYITSDNTATFLDGLDLATAPASGDSYELYSGTYSGAFYDDTNDEWVLGKVPYDSGAGVFPLVDYQDLHVKSLTVSSVTGFVTNPSLTTSNLTNVSSISQANVSMISTEPDRTLSGCFRVTPTSSTTVTSFEFALPNVTTNWSNSYDISITLNGHHDNTNFYSVENIVGYAVASSTRAKIKFTSGSTSEHIIQFLVRYTVV